MSCSRKQNSSWPCPSLTLTVGTSPLPLIGGCSLIAARDPLPASPTALGLSVVGALAGTGSGRPAATAATQGGSGTVEASCAITLQAVLSAAAQLLECSFTQASRQGQGLGESLAIAAAMLGLGVKAPSTSKGSPTTRAMQRRCSTSGLSCSRSWLKRPRCSAGRGVTLSPSGSQPARPMRRRPTSRAKTERAWGGCFNAKAWPQAPACPAAAAQPNAPGCEWLARQRPEFLVCAKGCGLTPAPLPQGFSALALGESHPSFITHIAAQVDGPMGVAALSQQLSERWSHELAPSRVQAQLHLQTIAVAGSATERQQLDGVGCPPATSCRSCMVEQIFTA